MNEHDDLTNALSHELHDRADAMAGTSLGLADVQRRARSVRRRRAATGMAGALAALGLIVPTAALATHSGSHRDEPLPATQSVSPTPTTTSEAQAPLDVLRMAHGASPAYGYLQSRVLHEPAGGGVAVRTDAPVDRVAVLVDGTAVYHTRDDQGRTHVQVAWAAGGLSAPFPAAEGLAVNAARTVAVWTTPDGHVWGVQETNGTARTVRIDATVPGAAPQVEQVTGNSCSGGAGCQVLVRTSDPANGDVRTYLVSSQGGVDPADATGRFTSVTSMSGTGLFAGLTRVTDSGSCSGVARADGAVTWRTCRHTLLSFSPDARYLSADSAYHDGPGSSVFAAYAADGTLAFEHRSGRSSQAFVAQSVWEDDTHLLGTVFQGGLWYVVRFGVDGSMELAAGPAKGDVAQSPFVLPGAR